MKHAQKVLSLMAALLLLFSSLALPSGHSRAATAGFSISGRKLLDANGNNFIIRGISHPHTWYATQTSSFANIKATGANTVRVVLSGGRWTKNTAADVANVINLCKTNKLICVLEDHDGTGYGEDTSAYSMTQIVNYWKEIQSVLTGQEAYVIINIANEPYGNNNPSGWVADTKAAIASLRAAGFKHTLMVDAPSWGQDWAGVMKTNAASVFASDPDRNVIFSVHMYGVYDTAAEIKDYLAAFATANLPLVIGEFGFNHSDGNPDEDTIMSEAVTQGVGYMGWSWSGNGGGVEYLDMVTGFDPTRPTTWGTRIISGANGISTTSQQASVYDGPLPTTPPVTPGTVTATSTSTSTFTPSPTIPSTGALKVQLMGNGNDNSQQSSFKYVVKNTGAAAASNVSVRLYFTTENSLPASSYVLEKYYDQSGVATIAGPTLFSGSTYYYTVNYGSASLAAGASWEYQTAFHLSSWGSTYSGANDWWHSTGALPTALTDWANLPAYLGSSLAWGAEPGGSPITVTPTNTATHTATVVTPTNTHTPTKTATVVTATPTFTYTPTTRPTTTTPTITSTVVTPSVTPTIITPTVTKTATTTFTPSVTPTGPVPPPSTLKVQIVSSGTDNNQQTAFKFVVKNVGSTAQSNVSVRIYYTAESGQSGSAYMLEKYWDQSGVAVISGPVLVSGSNYYFTISYGTASLAAGASWEFQTAMHLTSWGSSFSSANDWWHTTGVLPAALTDWTTIPAYVGASRVWGTEPGGAVLPDLIITGMAVSLQGSSCTSTTLGVRVSFTNAGNQAVSSGFMVSVNGTGTSYPTGLIPGQIGSVWVPGYPTMGTASTATVDSTGLVAESNELNNSLTQVLPIPTLPPCLPTYTPTPSPTTVTVTPTITPITLTPSPTATIPSGATYTGNATHFTNLGAPYGGCGLPESEVDSTNYVALNVQNTLNDYSTFLARPISSQFASQIGFFNNGLNCGRWVRVSISDYCTGINDGAAGQPFCRNGSWVADQYSGATLDFVVTDSCQDGNAWCRDDANHLDLSTSSLTKFLLNGQAVDLTNKWNNRKINWQFITAPNYTGDIRIGFMQGAEKYWTPIAINHLFNGIHGVEYFQNGAWVRATMFSDLGQGYMIQPMDTNATVPQYRIRVYDVNDQLIQNGRTYTFSFPTACGTKCSAPFTLVAYTNP